MRGTHQRHVLALQIERIIPAYAGNTVENHKRLDTSSDHPRVCGEHTLKTHEWPYVSGSSPRMRGTRMSVAFNMTFLRIIPAYAGNTCRTRSTWPRSSDHPRVCGEHFTFIDTPPNWGGSSPRMRGTPWPASAQRTPLRIIPAYAGNTSGSVGVKPCRPDHPRVCGEHTEKVRLV